MNTTKELLSNIAGAADLLSEDKRNKYFTDQDIELLTQVQDLLEDRVAALDEEDGWPHECRPPRRNV